MNQDILTRISERLNDSPMETERLLDDCADEIQRLRELLLENDIDPEPYVPPPEQFGPPTYYEYLMHQQMVKVFERAAADLLKPNPYMESLAYNDAAGPIGCNVRIRLPADYSVTR